MGAPFTQAEIQAEIDNCKTRLRESMEAQQYSYDQGPVGQFGVQKGDVKKIKEVMQYWIDMMDEYYPTVFQPASNITFNEIGYKQG